jgi:hypothetical protein
MPEKYEISDSQCKPVQVESSHIVPVVNLGQHVTKPSHETILKRFFDVLGVSEFNIVRGRKSTQKYLYKNKSICDLLLRHGPQLANPKEFVKYFALLESRVSSKLRVIQSFHLNVFEPLRITFEQLQTITGGFHFKGDWKETHRDVYEYCNKEVQKIIDIYRDGDTFLGKLSSRLRDNRDHLRERYMSFIDGIKMGGLVDPKHSVDGLRLYFHIVETTNRIVKDMVRLTKGRMSFIYYDHHKKNWEIGKQLEKSLQCMRDIIQQEYIYCQKTIPLAGESDQARQLSHYMDKIKETVENSRYISTLDRSGRVVFSERILPLSILT